MEVFENLCETQGNALDVYILAHCPGEVSLENNDDSQIQRAEFASKFLKTVSASNAKYEAVADGIDDMNPDTGGRVFVKSRHDYAAIYIDRGDNLANVLKFLENIDAFAIAAENHPDDGGAKLTVDWRVENVKF